LLIAAMFAVTVAGCGSASAQPPVCASTSSAAASAVAAPTGSIVAAPSASAAAARAVDPPEALTRLFTQHPARAEWFAPAFLDQVPFPQIEKLLASFADLGAFEAAAPSGDHAYVARFAHGTMECGVQLDGEGRFIGLLLKPPVYEKLTLEQVAAELRALPGRVTLLVTTDDVSKLEIDADRPMAVGSTHKLWILRTLMEQIKAKKRDWKDVVRLRREWKTLPSGLLQDWPDETPLTIETLATLMISRSDNTATNAMLSIVGRESVEANSTERPFLSTREFFVLKWGGDDRLAAYRKADEKGRRAILAEVDKLPNPPVEKVDQSKVKALDVEWHYSARQKCTMMKSVAALPMMGVNPGVAHRQDWSKIAYKGGSEPGVLDMTTQVTSLDGKHTHCVSVSWNDEAAPVDDTKLALLYEKLLAVLK
jgi:beta-lactamase class A